jgi:hypothetical protein
MRAKGVVVTLPETKPVGLADAAKKILAERKARLDADRARKPAIPVPNYKCYPDAFKQYDPKTGRWTGGRLPKCRVCEVTLQPTENHVCEGFKPKYVEHDADWHERLEARREEIRASKHRIITCSGCGSEIESEDEARWHDEHCERDEDSWNRDQYAINGDEDDLSGYEDEPEEDYCEGDDDGYDCD